MVESLDKKIAIVTLAVGLGLVIYSSFKKGPSKPKQQLSYQVTPRDIQDLNNAEYQDVIRRIKGRINEINEPNKPVFTSEEQETVDNFDLDYRTVMYRKLSRKPFKHIVDGMLARYEHLSPKMQKQVKYEMEGGLVFLKSHFWDGNEFCPYHSRAIELGLQVEK